MDQSEVGWLSTTLLSDQIQGQLNSHTVRQGLGETPLNNWDIDRISNLNGFWKTPDIVLFNNADGNYEASFKSNAVVYAASDADVAAGVNNMLMVPPAIYKSSCTIDVTYFPFDEQHCEMRFGSWTFDASQVKLVREKPMANLDDYLPSGTWDVIDAPC